MDEEKKSKLLSLVKIVYFSIFLKSLDFYRIIIICLKKLLFSDILQISYKLVNFCNKSVYIKSGGDIYFDAIYTPNH